MSVSVVIPTYNRAHTLNRALDSVFAQSVVPDETIVVDDGSDDQTAELINSNYPDVTYIPQPNRGVSSARNTGIRHACGTWIALLDADDQWLPDKLATQLAALRGDPDCRVAHCDEIWIRDGVRVNQGHRHRKAGGWIFQHSLPLCVMSPSAVVIHREIFHRVGLFNEDLPVCEDYDLWLRICARYPVHYIELPLLVKFGGHADQLSRRYRGMDRFRVQALDNILTHGELTGANREAARRELLKKVDVYLKGARKRRKHADMERYQGIRARHDGYTRESCSQS